MKIVHRENHQGLRESHPSKYIVWKTRKQESRRGSLQYRPIGTSGTSWCVFTFPTFGHRWDMKFTFKCKLYIFMCLLTTDIHRVEKYRTVNKDIIPLHEILLTVESLWILPKIIHLTKYKQNYFSR